MDMQLSDKTAVVTGASMGIGNAIARGLAAEGVQLCVVARRRNLLEKLSQTIVSAGGKAPFLVDLDIMEEQAPEKLASMALDAMGHVDILANAAGGSRLGVPIHAAESEWEEMMRLNFVRIRQVTNLLVPQMMERKWGRVINITGKLEPSITTLGFLGATPAKAAMHAWSKELSRHVGKRLLTIGEKTASATAARYPLPVSPCPSAVSRS